MKKVLFSLFLTFSLIQAYPPQVSSPTRNGRDGQATATKLMSFEEDDLNTLQSHGTSYSNVNEYPSPSNANGRKPVALPRAGTLKSLSPPKRQLSGTRTPTNQNREPTSHTGRRTNLSKPIQRPPSRLQRKMSANIPPGTILEDGNIRVIQSDKDVEKAIIYDTKGNVLQTTTVSNKDHDMIEELKAETYIGKRRDSDFPGKPGTIHVSCSKFSKKLNKNVNGLPTSIINKGIIANGNRIAVNGFQGYPKPSKDLTSLTSAKIFEDITDEEPLLYDTKNYRYLVHYAPDGRKWRTKDQATIKKVLKSNLQYKDELIDDGGYTEYNNGSRIWSINDGIIENDVFVTMSKHLVDHGKYFEYQWGNDIVKWTNFAYKNQELKNREGEDSSPQ